MLYPFFPSYRLDWKEEKLMEKKKFSISIEQKWTDEASQRAIDMKN